MHNIKTISFTLLLLGTGLISVFAQNKITHEEYIETYYRLAVEEMERAGIPASITLAQGILESGSGNSDLAKIAKNHFGIKCHKDWEGEGYIMDDDTEDECFRVYETADESFRDHSDFIRGRPWYKSLFDLEITDYTGWAKGLKKAGYATNPKYAELLISLIERHELQQYDLMSSSEWLPVVDDGQEEKEWESTPDFYANRIPDNYHGEVIEVNGKRAVIALEDQTALAIALEQGINLGDLYGFNDLPMDAEILPGSYVFLQQKKRKGPVKLYVAQKGESMHDISQKFGIRLNKLYDRNNMSGTEQPKPGETLYLKKQNPVKPATRSYKEMLDEKHQIEAQYQKGLVSTYTTKPKEEPAVKKQPTVPAQTEEKPVEKLESATKDVLEETPSEATTASTHTVQPGDTLYSIALRYNVTIDEIKEMNGLSSNTIKVGQELKVGK